MSSEYSYGSTEYYDESQASIILPDGRVICLKSLKTLCGVEEAVPIVIAIKHTGQSDASIQFFDDAFNCVEE